MKTGKITVKMFYFLRNQYHFIISKYKVHLFQQSMYVIFLTFYVNITARAAAKPKVGCFY